MKTVKIKLDTIEKVKEFSNVISTVDCCCDIVSESKRYIIDAKSIMGIFSLDLRKTLELKIHSDDIAKVGRIEKLIEKFKV